MSELHEKVISGRSLYNIQGFVILTATGRSVQPKKITGLGDGFSKFVEQGWLLLNAHNKKLCVAWSLAIVKAYRDLEFNFSTATQTLYNTSKKLAEEHGITEGASFEKVKELAAQEDIDIILGEELVSQVIKNENADMYLVVDSNHCMVLMEPGPRGN